jgi:pyruvate dehydrogenase E2 component (dihydrolipoamide acetyltransferase)
VAPAKAAGPATASPPAGPPAQAAAGGASGSGAGRVIASPLSRRLATEAGLDIRQIKGSGPGGRVVKRDIEQAAAQQAALSKAPAPAAVVAPATAPLVPGEGDQVLPMSMMRKTIARRLTEAKQTVPHFYLTTEAGVDDLWRFREQLNAAGAAAAGKGEPLPGKVSINDLVVKATARALRALPAANMSFSPEGAVRHPRVDVGVAVALEDGLMTPIVRNADQKSVGAISAEVRELAERAKQKKLRPEEYQGGSFSVSNLGMYGIREFFAIINPPESGILAVGQVEKRPVVVEKDGGDQVVIMRRMTLTLSCDHRIMDGALGARFLAEVVKALEHPLLLVL